MKETQLKELLRKSSTPLYVFDLAELKRRVQYLRQVLPEKVKLCYAVKANAFILEELSGLVDRLEICSPGELHICRQLGLPGEKFVVSGVYKEPALLRQWITQEEPTGVYTVESMTQLDVICQAAAAAKKRVPLLLRLTSGNQFGLDEAEIRSLIGEYRDSPFLDIRGIQYFSGTQKTSLKRLKRELDTLDSFLKELRDTWGYEARELEFGPGFPVSYFQGDSFEEAAFLEGFSQMLRELDFSGSITLELGRSIAASCGSYLTQVVDKKRNLGENYAIVDGGIHQIAYYGQFMAMKHPYVHILHREQAAKDSGEEPWNICGSLCTVNDILVKKLPLGNLNIGDVLVFENTGAYCMTEGISLFLTRDLPEVVLLQTDGTILTVRPRIQTHTLNIPNMKGEACYGKTD